MEDVSMLDAMLAVERHARRDQEPWTYTETATALDAWMLQLRLVVTVGERRYGASRLVSTDSARAARYDVLPSEWSYVRREVLAVLDSVPM